MRKQTIRIQPDAHVVELVLPTPSAAQWKENADAVRRELAKALARIEELVLENTELRKKLNND